MLLRIDEQDKIKDLEEKKETEQFEQPKNGDIKMKYCRLCVNFINYNISILSCC